MSERSRDDIDVGVSNPVDPREAGPGVYDQGAKGWQANAAETSPGYTGPSVTEEYAGERGAGGSAGVQGQAQEYAEKAREVASEYGQKAQDQIETGKDQAAIGIEKAAEKLRERAGQSGGMPAQATEKVAAGMENAATYLRDHSTNDIWADVEYYVREHPTQAVAGAVVAGFLLGRILR